MNKTGYILLSLLLIFIACDSSKLKQRVTSFTLVNCRDTLYYRRIEIGHNPTLIEEYIRRNSFDYIDKLTINKYKIYRKIGFPGYLFIPGIDIALKIAESEWLPIKNLKEGIVYQAIHDREYNGGIYSEYDSIYKGIVDEVKWIEIELVERGFSDLISDTTIIFQYRMKPPCANTPSFEEKEFDLYYNLIRYRYRDDFQHDTLEFVIKKENYRKYYPEEFQKNKIF